ncbi:hypothetical protein F8388_000846 [Cannabis sativa]|uniref:F-box domain-containing protein n=1 Tax=Cannabis sativa TaxID=3483 RepID=A0A7J6EQ38_CANSA|nr:hypothetical protein F8388_000846 [Cannabis sativa]
MSRRVRRKVARKGKEKVILPSYPEIEEEISGVDRSGLVDWTSLPHDTVIQLLSCLNYRDRASLSSTCKTWRLLGISPCLWSTLDLRAHKCDSTMAASLASRCVNLQKVRFRGAESADAIIHLQARNLREISGDYCRKISDASLSVIVARHEALESLQLGPDFCERISSDAIKAIALCCHKLKKLRLSGIRDVNADAMNALAKHCPNLTDIGFIDCLTIDEMALGNVVSVRFLSVAGTSNMKWGTVSHHWRKLPNLIGLDVSRTDIEWILSHTLLRIAESNQQGLDEFWLKQGASLLLNLMQSSQEDVQERAATGLATFVVIDDENASIDCGRAEAVMRDGGIRLLLNLAKSWREGLQSEAAKAIANLSVNANVAKAVAEEGGITILADLIFKWSSGGDGVLERAAGALANLAADDKCSTEVAVAGGVHALAARALANLAAHGDSNSNNAAVGQEAGALEALVQLTQSPHEGVRQEAAGALWNLSFDDRNREAIAAAGGVEALVALAQSCSNASPGLQERAAGALWGLSVSEVNSIAIGREGGVAPLIALARSEAEDVHETAAGALWNLAFNPGNALRIVEEGGVPALVHLCSSSVSKMARFMAALALAYMFDGRMDEYALVGTSSDSMSKSVSLDGARRMALKHIEAFVLTFSDPQSFAAAAASSAPAALAQVTEGARIQEAGHLRCRLEDLLPCYGIHHLYSRHVLRFALLQFTIPGGRHAVHHASLMQNAGAGRVLRAAAAAATAPLEAKIFARIVLRNLEHHHIESSL